MRMQVLAITAVVGCLLAPVSWAEGAQQSQSPALRTEQPTVPLSDLLTLMRKNEGASYLVHWRVPGHLVTGTLNIKQLTEGSFAALLLANGLTLEVVDGLQTIIPVAQVRHSAMPIRPVDGETAAYAVVTRVIAVEQIRAPSLVPILRPLMPSWGHLAAHPESNQIIVTDTQANFEKIAAIIERVDVAHSPSAD